MTISVRSGFIRARRSEDIRYRDVMKQIEPRHLTWASNAAIVVKQCRESIATRFALAGILMRA
jgi:hypothetical protein